MEQLLDAIRRGDFTPGDKLPNENDLTAQLGVSRTVAREAMEMASSEQRPRIEHDIAFHLAIAHAAGNAFLFSLTTVITSFLQIMRSMRTQVGDWPRDPQRSLTRHRSIYEAISRHDPPAAVAAMEAHLRDVLEQYEMVQHGPPRYAPATRQVSTGRMERKCHSMNV